jgi:Protein of unknown function (DUF3052)
VGLAGEIALKARTMTHTFDLSKLGLQAGYLIMEIGYQGDCDEELRASLTALTGAPLLDESAQEVVEAVFIWYRDGDGELSDFLMDGLTYLSSEGSLWLLTPKYGCAGYVEASEITDAVQVAGLAQSTSFLIAHNWSATRIVVRKGNIKGNK